MKLFQLQIILASCSIFSMLANDRLLCDELDSYSEPNVLLAQSQCSIRQRYCLLSNVTPNSIHNITFRFQISFTIDMFLLASNDKRMCPVKSFELQTHWKHDNLICVQLSILVN